MAVSVYYNEFDPAAAAWLRELISAGLIAPGDVDERSIDDVRPDDIAGYNQCHFFAGIGGWSHALRLAGIPDDYPVWTASCPCQPFSGAGKGLGFADDRHLWPSFYWLVSQCRPSVIVGEQVASKATGDWFDLVQADLEALGYAFGLVPFPAAGIGAPHIRDRAYWVGHCISEGLEGLAGHVNGTGEWAQPARSIDETGGIGGLAYSEHARRWPINEHRENGRHGPNSGWQETHGEPGACVEVCGLAVACRSGLQSGRETTAANGHGNTAYANGGRDRPGPNNGHGGTADWLLCRDGKWRPVEPGTFPLVDGLPRGVVPECDPGAPGYAEKTAEARVMRLRGYGNAIVPQQAAIFISEALA